MAIYDLCLTKLGIAYQDQTRTIYSFKDSNDNYD